MTGYSHRHGVRRDDQPTSRDRTRRVALALLSLALLAAAGAAGAAPAGDGVQGNDTAFDHAPPNGTYEVEVTPSEPETARVVVELTYEARSDEELHRAREDSLSADWFRGEEIVEEAVAARGGSSDDLENRRTVAHLPREDGDTIRLRHRAVWTGVAEPDEDRIVIGPGFASPLDDGDEFRVAIEVNVWENWTVNRDEPRTRSHAEDVYAWTIGSDPEPRVVLRHEDYRPASDESDELGPVTFLLPVSALLLVAVAVARRR